MASTLGNEATMISNNGTTTTKRGISLARRMQQRGYDSDEEVEESDDTKTIGQHVTAFLKRAIATLLRLGVYIQLNYASIRVNPCTYCLGLASCITVVAITALMVTTLGNLPILFLRLAEVDNGEIDVILTPGGEASGAQSLNYSRVLKEPLFYPDKKHSYHSPRILLSTDFAVWPFAACSLSAVTPAGLAKLWYSPLNGTSSCPAKQGCPQRHCLNTTVSSGRGLKLYLVDFTREKRMQLGRNWGAPTPGLGEVVLHATIAKSMSVDVGDHIIIKGNFGYGLLEAFINADLDDWIEEPYTTWGTVIVSFRVSAIVSSPEGKLADDSGNWAFANYHTSIQHISTFLNPAISANRKTLFGLTNPETLATQIIFNFPPDLRRVWYGYTDYVDVLDAATAFASPVITTLGYNQVDIAMPIVTYFEGVRFFSLFLGLILSIIIAGLSVLSIILIYSLLTIGIETRSFELGVMRMVGMTRENLAAYVVTGAMMFALPACVVGLVLAQLLFLLIRELLSTAIEADLNPTLAGDAIGYSILAGIGIPLFSSIAPTLEVLAQSLPDALDTTRGRIVTILYDIRNGAEESINWTVVFLGAALAIFGFLIYYLFPLSLLLGNITLLFYIFFGILLGMLFGLVLLAINFESLVETMVAYAFFWMEHEVVFQLVQKNLVAHRRRNRKTSLMFAMALGFIIFISVAFGIQILSVQYEIARDIGGDLAVQPSNKDGDFSYKILEAVDRRLRELRGNGTNVRWTWGAAPAPQQLGVANATLETVGRFATQLTQVHAIAPNFWDVANPDFLIIDSERPSGYSLGESLYTNEGSGRLVVSTSMEEKFALDSLDVKAMMRVDRRDANRSAAFSRSVWNTQALLDASPVYRFSQFPNVQQQSAALSLPSLIYRTGPEVMVSVELTRFDTIVMDCLQDSGCISSVQTAISRVIDIAGGSATAKVVNYQDRAKGLDVANTVVGFFFAFTQIVALFICLFALIASMTTNIYEQTKEIGILRAIGIKKWPCTRAYVEEAFILVFASGMLGIVVGVGVAYTILLQRALFTQLPLPFVFPWLNVVVLLAVSILFAFVSTFTPIRALLAAPSITTILRRTI